MKKILYNIYFKRVSYGELAWLLTGFSILFIIIYILSKISMDLAMGIIITAPLLLFMTLIIGLNNLQSSNRNKAVIKLCKLYNVLPSQVLIIGKYALISFDDDRKIQVKIPSLD